MKNTNTTSSTVYVGCPDCDYVYIGESGRRIEERVLDHAGRDRNSHVYKHSLTNGHTGISIDNVEIISSSSREGNFFSDS